MEKLKELSKKWWFWVIVVVLVFGIIGMGSGETSNTNENDTNKNETKQTVKYELTGEELGEYGKEVILNKDTDMPAKKYLYKLPAGKYKATTTFEKMAAFWIVKDEVVKTGTEAYPEELDYVSEQYSLTAGDNDFNGMAKKEVEFTLNDDESILLIGTNKFIFEKID